MKPANPRPRSLATSVGRSHYDADVVPVPGVAAGAAVLVGVVGVVLEEDTNGAGRERTVVVTVCSPVARCWV